jgi:hypothetical protein
MVGPGSNHSNCLRELVDRIPQRLVLNDPIGVSEERSDEGIWVLADNAKNPSLIPGFARDDKPGLLIR